MNNKKDIEEDIKKTKNYIDGWRDSLTDEDGYPKEILDEDSENFIYAIENILTDRERLEKENENWEKYNLEKEEDITELNNKLFETEAKANKYDSLVEKIKQKKRHFEEYDELIATSNGNYSDGTVIKRFIDTLQELLDTEK